MHAFLPACLLACKYKVSERAAHPASLPVLLTCAACWSGRLPTSSRPSSLTNSRGSCRCAQRRCGPLSGQGLWVFVLVLCFHLCRSRSCLPWRLAVPLPPLRPLLPSLIFLFLRSSLPSALAWPAAPCLARRRSLTTTAATASNATSGGWQTWGAAPWRCLPPRTLRPRTWRWVGGWGGGGEVGGGGGWWWWWACSQQGGLAPASRARVERQGGDPSACLEGALLGTCCGSRTRSRSLPASCPVPVLPYSTPAPACSNLHRVSLVPPAPALPSGGVCGG